MSGCAVCGKQPKGVLGPFVLCDRCWAYADKEEHKVVFGLECDCRRCQVVRHVARLGIRRSA